MTSLICYVSNNKFCTQCFYFKQEVFQLLLCLNFNPHCWYLAWTPTISTPSTPQRKKYIIGWWSLIPNFQTELSGNYQGLTLLCSFYNFVVLLVVNNKCQKLLAHNTMLLMTENIFHLFQSGYCTSVPLIAVEPCLVLWNGMEYSGQWSKVSLVVLCKQGSHFSNNILVLTIPPLQITFSSFF